MGYKMFMVHICTIFAMVVWKGLIKDTGFTITYTSITNLKNITCPSLLVYWAYQKVGQRAS